MMRPLWVLTYLLLCMPVTRAFAQTSSGEIVSIYSDVCFHEEGGDLLGDRLLLISANGQDFVVLQSAEGVWLEPQSGRAELNGSNLSFNIDDTDGQMLSFVGTVTPATITGRYSSDRTDRFGNREFRYARQPNIETTPPIC